MSSTGSSRSCQLNEASMTASSTTQSGMRSAVTASNERPAWPGALTSRMPPSIRITRTTAGTVQISVMNSALIMPSGLMYCTSSSIVGRSCRLRYHSRSTSSTSGNAGSTVKIQLSWARRRRGATPPTLTKTSLMQHVLPGQIPDVRPAHPGLLGHRDRGALLRGHLGLQVRLEGALPPLVVGVGERAVEREVHQRLERVVVADVDAPRLGAVQAQVPVFELRRVLGLVTGQDRGVGGDRVHVAV